MWVLDVSQPYGTPHPVTGIFFSIVITLKKSSGEMLPLSERTANFMELSSSLEAG
jgi:hypothetical protein